MIKKLFLTTVVAFVLTFSNCFSQNTTKPEITAKPTAEFVDGLLHIKLIDSYPTDFKVNADKTIDPKELSFLKKYIKKYQITAIRQDFTLNNDPKLLRTLTIVFENTDKTDNLIHKLEKNRKIEYVERVGIKKPMKAKALPPKPKNK